MSLSFKLPHFYSSSYPISLLTFKEDLPRFHTIPPQLPPFVTFGGVKQGIQDQERISEYNGTHKEIVLSKQTKISEP